MRIFVATTYLPRADMSSGDRRLVEILKILGLTHEVTLMVNWIHEPVSESGRYFAEIKAAGVKHVYVGFTRMFLPMIKERFELAYLEYYHTATRLAAEFRQAQPGAPVLVDTVDIHFAREAIGVALGELRAEVAVANKNEEISVYRSADGIVVVTSEDEQVLRAEIPEARIWKIPNIIPPTDRRPILRKPKLLFVGGFRHLPNVDGMLWFVKSIWPLIRASVSDVELLVVGSNPPESITALSKISGVTVTGFVPDTQTYLDQAAVSIAPLRYGAGMKGKVTEALAAGVPVVSTSFGAQGFGAVSGEHLLVSDKPEEFAEHVVHLLKNPVEAEAMGQKGRNLVRILCSPEVVTEMVEKIVTEAVHRKRAGGVLGGRLFYLAATVAKLPPKLFRKMFP